MSAHRDEYGQARTEYNEEFYAHSPQKGEWYLEHNGYCFAKLYIETETRKQEDWSGQKKYRLLRTQNIKANVRIYTMHWYEISETFMMHLGEIQAVKRILELCAKEDCIYKQARYDCDIKYKDQVSSGEQTRIWWDNYNENEKYVYEMMKVARIVA